MGVIEDFITAYTEKLHIDCAEDDGPVVPFWNALGYDRFYDTLMPEMAPAFERIASLAPFRWLRCHGIFREDELDRPGAADFADQKRCIDLLLRHGIRPVMELSRIPRPFQNAESPLGFGGDVAGWAAFVTRFVRFLLETYGAEEVRSWPFEFWNEPDHHFWSGDQPLDWRGMSNRRRIDEYCRMYDWTARAVKNADPALRVGGPALTGNTVFLREFLRHCREGRNDATGETGAPLDFLSFHCYSNSPERAPCMENVLGRMLEMRESTARYGFGETPWLLTEWGVTWGGGRTVPDFPVQHRNTLRAATFTLKLLKELRRFPLEMALFWGFSEWAWKRRGPGASDFSGHRALLTYSHIERPVTAAYRLLARLSGTYVHVHRMTDTNNVDALAAVEADRLTALVWHHDPDPHGAAYPSRTEIVLDKLPLPDGPARLRMEGYTRAHNTHAAWQRAGEPAAPSKEDIETIQAHAAPTLLRDETVTVRDGMVSTGEFRLHPGECLCLTVTPPATDA